MPSLATSILVLAASALIGGGLAALAWAFFRHHTQSVTPVTRDMVIENLNEGLLTTDAQQRIVDINPAACRIFGLTRTQVLGQSISAILGPYLDLADRTQALAEATGEIVVGEGAAQRVFQIHTSPLSRRPGALAGWLVVIRDIMAFKQAEQALYLAKVAAESANQAKSAFLAIVSHEIRTPMNGMISMADLLLETKLTTQQREFGQIIRNSSTTLLRMTNDILDFSKIEAGQLDLDEHPFVLRECAESALDLVAATAMEKDLDLACLIDADVPIGIVADSARLRQILVNLLHNAVKFTERGEVVVSIRSEYKALRAEVKRAPNNQLPAARSPHYGYELHVLVRDTGIGIPADRIGHLFRLFHQSDASVARNYGGTGLGLAISKRLVELMGGRMWVESQIGQGSTFHFTIGVQADEVAPPGYLLGVPLGLRGCRVLIVDDHSATRQMLAMQLEAWAMEPVAVASGEAALALVQAGETFDLAILDMQMPGMDGLTLAGELRHYHAAASLPLVMLTSLGQQINDARFTYVAASIAKPIKTAQLHTLITVFANRPHAQLADDAAAELDDEHNLFDPDMARRLPLRLLVVEDNEINQEVLVQILAQLGYQARIAENGVVALEALRCAAYDIVLMDVQMPQMDGLETTRRIRSEIAPDQQPCVIAVTANVVRGEREECFAAGMDGYISKPIDLRQLIAAIEQAGTHASAISGGIGASPPEAVPTPSAAKPDDDSILNAAALQRLYSSLGPQVGTVLPGLLKSFAENAGQLHKAAREMHTPEGIITFHRAAHTLKANGELFGALTLAEHCRELEHCAKVGTLEGADELLVQIEVEFARALAALHALLADPTNDKMTR
jgi:PAS domain S-box-containing protein